MEINRQQVTDHAFNNAPMTISQRIQQLLESYRMLGSVYWPVLLDGQIMKPEDVG